MRLAGLGIGKIDVAMLVIAGEGLDPQGAAVDPAEARNVVLTGLNGQLDPHGLAAAALTTPTRTSGLGSPGCG